MKISMTQCLNMITVFHLCLTCQDKKEVIKSLVGKVNNQDDQITKFTKGGLSTYGGDPHFHGQKSKLMPK